MRIRTIKPEFFLHEGLFELEKSSKLPIRIAFVGLWCAADREGRFKWEPRRLGVSILPYDDVEFSRVLDALTTRGYLLKYAFQGSLFGVIPSFTRHQVINNKEKRSDLPEPSAGAECDATATREARVDHACRKEGKGREQGKEGNNASLTRESFEAFWEEYPKKKSRGDAEKAWEKHGCSKLLPAILAKVAEGKKSHDWTKDGGQWVPYPASWLNAKGWEDDFKSAPAGNISPARAAADAGRHYAEPAKGRIIDPNAP